MEPGGGKHRFGVVGLRTGIASRESSDSRRQDEKKFCVGHFRFHEFASRGSLDQAVKVLFGKGRKRNNSSRFAAGAELVFIYRRIELRR